LKMADIVLEQSDSVRPLGPMRLRRQRRTRRLARRTRLIATRGKMLDVVALAHDCHHRSNRSPSSQPSTAIEMTPLATDTIKAASTMHQPIIMLRNPRIAKLPLQPV